MASNRTRVDTSGRLRGSNGRGVKSVDSNRLYALEATSIAAAHSVSLEVQFGFLRPLRVRCLGEEQLNNDTCAWPPTKAKHTLVDGGSRDSPLCMII